MNLGLNLGLGRQTGGRIQLPANFWSTATGGYLLLPGERSSVFQDTAGTTPVTAAGQPVQRINDQSPFGNNFTQATTPPTFATVSGFDCLDFDGTDDFLQSTATVNPGTTDKCQVFIGVRKNSDAAAGILLEASINAAGGTGRFYVSAPEGAAASYGFFLRGNANTVLRTATTFTSPVTNVITCLYDIAQATRETQIVPTINGVTPTLATSGTTTTAANFSTQTHYIARRAGTSLPANVDVFAILVRYGPVLSAADVTQVNRFISSYTPGNLIP